MQVSPICRIFSYSYLHRNGMAGFRIRVNRAVRFAQRRVLYPYNLEKMSKNSFIHTDAERHDASDGGDQCPIMRRVIKIYKRECRRQQE